MLHSDKGTSHSQCSAWSKIAGPLEISTGETKLRVFLQTARTACTCLIHDKVALNAVLQFPAAVRRAFGTR